MIQARWSQPRSPRYGQAQTLRDTRPAPRRGLRRREWGRIWLWREPGRGWYWEAEHRGGPTGLPTAEAARAAVESRLAGVVEVIQ